MREYQDWYDRFRAEHDLVWFRPFAGEYAESCGIYEIRKFVMDKECWRLYESGKRVGFFTTCKQAKQEAQKRFSQ